jgi:hypothetical protein
MNIYQAEIEAGLSEVLSAKSSIVYASLAEKSSDSTINRVKIEKPKALAGIEDTDLYYTQSILVTTSWNKNDDIFDPKEVWAARSTPNHKPTNLEHNENIIVGHITSNWPIDENGKLIDENTPINELPEKFHILTGSVIYKGYTEPDLKERSMLLIEEIENGEKYVSMECFFKGFDYGLIDNTSGKFHVLARNEDTAFLTKYLRAYGGQGEHQNYKIGRVLKDITFSGKGFVNRPANPESIIFTKDSFRFLEQSSAKKINEKNDDSTKEGVFSNQANLKETIMSVESNTTPAEEVTVETPVAEATVETVAETQTPTEPETSVVEHEEAAKKMKEDMMKKEEEMKKMKAAIETIQNELNLANEALAAYKNKEAEMMKKEKMMKRKASLVENGVDEDTANATVEKFEALDDDAFAGMVALVAAMKPAKMAKKEDTKAEETETTVKTEDVSLALENVETDQEIDLSVGSETESEIQNTRAALVDFVCIRLGKNLNKGE